MSTLKEDKPQPPAPECLNTSKFDTNSPISSPKAQSLKPLDTIEPLIKEESMADRVSAASQKDKNSSEKIPNIFTDDEEIIEIVDFHTNQTEVQRQALAIFISTKTDIFTCPICYIDYMETDAAKSLKCNHKFCMECLELYIKAKIDVFQLIDIKCPKDGCKYIIHQSELVEILDQSTYEKYQTLLDLKLKNKAGNNQYCPHPGCARQLKIMQGQEFTKCECGTLICNKCIQPKHDGKTCSQVLKERDELYSNNKNAKMCIVCKSAVEKMTGCSHIRCPVCDYEWCWDCGREWGPGHSRKCTHIWDPAPPGAFSEKVKPDIFTQFMLAALLLLEMIFCYIVAMFGVLFMWPFAVCVYFGQKSQKMKCLKTFLGFLGGILTWPLATVVVPMVIVIEEYCTCCRFSRRWLRGNVETFGLGRHQANGQHKEQKDKTEKGEKNDKDRQGFDVGLNKDLEKRQEDAIDLELGRSI